MRFILTWGSAPHPGSVACGDPDAPRRSLAGARCAPPVMRLDLAAPGRNRSRYDILLASRMTGLILAIGVLLTAPSAALAQNRGTPPGEWRYQSADAWGTRYSPLDQISAENFEKLEVAWVWRGDNFSPSKQTTSRSTPSYINGTLYTVAGSRRTVVAIDPATGENLWTYREPNTTRWERSMRQSYGKGVAYTEIDGRGVIYITTPGYFLHAIDARTGQPLENWGQPVPLPGFPKTGVVDLLQDQLRDWGPWQEYVKNGGKYDPDLGVPKELGYITTSSPPIVVNGVVVVGSSAEQGYNQTRIENVPNDILAYDARTGKHLWKFHVIPRPGEVGHETWQNDAWKYTGDVSSWAPVSADLERGLVFIPTNPPTIDYFNGFRPGAALFGTSTIALDVKTGKRVWHFQTVHSDQWNYDLPNVPIVVDLTMGGKKVPAVIQTTKQGFIFAFNRETGEPLWPIEEKPVPQTEVPGNYSYPTQPIPTKPEPMEPQGLSEQDLIDFTPALKQEALEIIKKYRIGGSYVPRLHTTYEGPYADNIRCDGGLNITHPAALDPTRGILYVAHARNCGGGRVMPGPEREQQNNDPWVTGKTLAQWVAGPGGRLQGPQGLPIFKPPYARVSAYDMNTGERIWWMPTGSTPAPIKNNPALKGVELPETGGGRPAILMVTGTLLLTGEVIDGKPYLVARDKRTGEPAGKVALPAAAQYGMMTYLHQGRQFIVVQIGGDEYPGSLAALALPRPAATSDH